MEKKKKKFPVKYLVLAGLLIFVCVYYRSFLSDAWAEIRKLSAGQLTAVICLSFGAQFLEGRVIRLMMKKYVPDYAWRRGIRCALISSFYRFATLGSGGMAAEVVVLSKDGADPARAAGMSMVQYLFHKVAITVYGIAGFLGLLFFTDSSVKEYLPFLWIGTMITGLIAVFLVLICTSGRFSRACFGFAEKVLRGRFEDKLTKAREKTDILQSEARSLLGPSESGKGRGTALLKVFWLDVLKLTCWYLVPCVALAGKSGVSMGEIVALTASAQMLAGVIPAPAGIGSLEFVFLLFSTRVVEEGSAVAAMLLLRAAINLIPFVPGMILSVWPKRRQT